jgi:hypothetical protein
VSTDKLLSLKQSSACSRVVSNRRLTMQVGSSSGLVPPPPRPSPPPPPAGSGSCRMSPTYSWGSPATEASLAKRWGCVDVM